MTFPRFTAKSLSTETASVQLPAARAAAQAAATAAGAAAAGAAAAGAAAASGAGAAAAAPTTSFRAAAPSTVFVELGQAAQTAQIARDGIGVAQVALNADALQNLIIGRPQLVTKVVSQSVAPGTAVPRGTSVDVVLAQPGVLPIDVIRDPHLALSGRTLSNVYETFVRDNAAVKNVLARNEQAATLSTADRGVIEAAFQAQDVSITADPGHTIEQAFGSLQAAFTFGT
jgi:hypothetical protein